MLSKYDVYLVLSTRKSHDTVPAGRYWYHHTGTYVVILYGVLLQYCRVL